MTGIRVRDTQAKARREFAGIPHYPVEARWVVEGRWEPANSARTLLVPNVLGMSPAHVWGVSSFYTTFRKGTDGKYLLYVCSTLPCAMRGSEKLFDHLSEKLGIKKDDLPPFTFPDVFTIKYEFKARKGMPPVTVQSRSAGIPAWPGPWRSWLAAWHRGSPATSA